MSVVRAVGVAVMCTLTAFSIAVLLVVVYVVLRYPMILTQR